MRRELKQRLSESRAERVRTLPSVSCFDRRSNIVNGKKRMTDSFGHSKDLITLSLSLSLSLSLRYLPTVAYTLLRGAGARVNIRLFLQ